MKNIKINKIIKKQRKSLEKQTYLTRAYYELRSLLSYWYMIFFILLGGRGAGKSFSVMQFFVDEFVNKHIPFYWIRLTDKSTEALLKNNAEKLVDTPIRVRYGLDLQVVGTTVYNVKRNKDGKIISKEKMCEVINLSTFYNQKGVAFYDFNFLNDPNMFYNICLDEMNREKGEKKTFDICYAFVNQIENLVRETNYRIRIIMIGNTLEEASDIMCMFNFIPEEFKRYKLVKNKKMLCKYLNEIKFAKTTKQKTEIKKKYQDYDFGKRAIVEYMPLTEDYKSRRKNCVADILMGQASTFTNKIKTDNTLVSKEKLIKPMCIIKFSKEPSDWFTLWNSNLIARWNKETLNNVISMRKYNDEMFNLESQNNVIKLFDMRAFKFRDLMTFKTFQKNLEILKPQR